MQTVFKRYELKYLLNLQQYHFLIELISRQLHKDAYGEYTVQSLYYDTENQLLTRRSIEKPEYKEKLRLRSYGLADKHQDVFLEIKKKVQGVVYKRRIALPEEKAQSFIYGVNLQATGQIEKEIAYFKRMYPSLRPYILILYDRTAFSGKDLRITFDKNIRYRQDGLRLDKDLSGIPMLEDNQVLMEIKTGYALPLWLVKSFSEYQIYKTNFSKIGQAYKLIHTKEETQWNIYLNPSLQIQN